MLPVMTRAAALTCLLLAFAPAGCKRSPAREAAREAEPECTLATALKPGVPGSPGHLIQTARNPNGQSELAALMRTMQADLQAARAAIGRGERVSPMLARHRKIRCSWPTQASDRDQAFDVNAQGYLRAIERLQTSPPDKDRAAAAFDGVLDACRTCHERVCSGALAAVEALRINPRPRPQPQNAGGEPASCDD
jgi:hypothetical protein